MSRFLPRALPANGLLATGGGVLVALSLPPWGWWPLAWIGIAMYAAAVGSGSSAVQRFRRGWLFAFPWLAIGMAWMWFLSAPGYIVASVVFAAYHGIAAAATPPGRWRMLALPAAHAAVEAVRLWFPFGGVPLATLGISQVTGPLGTLARIGGVVLITWATMQIGVALAALAQHSDRRRAWIGPAAVVVLLGLAAAAPSGRDVGTALRIAIVQGGGEQGTRAIDTDPRVVFERHLLATQQLNANAGIDLVVWPENVIDVARFAGSTEHAEIAAEARRLGAPFAVGVTEDAGDDHFTNAQVVVTPDGQLTGRYEKVRRVPFGEYMPLRGLLDALGAPTDLVPRDAVAGEGPAVLDLPDGARLAVVISWEVFFGSRARDGVGDGGQMIVNPTNGSSYTGTILQTQQVASSRLRAIEEGRWVVQASPTGFSAFVSPSGDVFDRTAVSEQALLVRDVPLREGRTWYSRLGDVPIAAAAAVAVGIAWAAARGRRRTIGDQPDDDHVEVTSPASV